MKDKLKMSNKKFMCIWIPIVGFLAIFCIVCNVLMNYFSGTMDTYLGRGERVVTGGANYDAALTDYYAQSYPRTSDGKIASSEAAAKVAEELSDGGEVLLKNDGVLPLAERAKVTPFGYRYVNPVLTGTGSGAATIIQDFVVSASDALNKYFDVNKTVESALKGASPVYATASGYKGAADQNGQFSGATTSVGEFAPAVYKASDVGDYKTGVVFLGRQCGEGDDLQMTPYYSDKKGGTQIARHQLELLPYEKQALDFAKTNCDKVVVIVNSANPLELGALADDPRVNAILWVGVTGARGFESMAKILCGKVNPSGKLPDTYARDFTADPTFANYGFFEYTNAHPYGTKDKPHPWYVEYEEGIYVGYKYYETRFTGAEYDDAVLYPFGYGLNYDDDKVTQSLASVTAENGVVTVKGSVTNASASYAVDEVVQIYFDPPYYKDGSGIEKAAKNLVAFDKINVPAGATKPFELTFDLEDLASYDYEGVYSEGAGSYVLERGDYNFCLGKDAHNEWGRQTLNVAATAVYYDAELLASPLADCEYVGKRASDETLATNLYDYASDYMDGVGEFGTAGACSNLTRADGLTSGTTAPTVKTAPAAAMTQFRNSLDGTFDRTAELKALYGEAAPVSGANNGLKLSELRGLAYGDAKWDELLDQLDYASIDVQYLIGYGAFRTQEVAALGKGATNDSDGPQAIGKTGMSDGKGAACAYPAEVVIAATWSPALAEKMGESIGEEALSQGANGWYAPACNIHRSPFLGRTYEYYSEDAVLSGYMTMYVVRGAGSKGFSPRVKHFALNDQEKERLELCTWANEQTMREIYFKPFEICVKKAVVEDKYLRCVDEEAETYEIATFTRKATTGIMTSFNYIGGVWTSLDRSLCTDLLRGEWGFEGLVITDSSTPVRNQCNAALSAGNDMWLTFMKGEYIKNIDDPLVRWTVRTAVHNICYSVVNSNAMQNIGPAQEYYYAMSPWAIFLTIGNVLIWSALIAMTVLTLLRLRDARRRPERYAVKTKK